MARSGNGSASFFLLFLVVLQCLSMVLCIPFFAAPRHEEYLQQQQKQQSSLKSSEHFLADGKEKYESAHHDDPLKDFVSDVVHDSTISKSNSDSKTTKKVDDDAHKTSRLTTTPPSSPSKVSSLRYTGYVDSLDNITIGFSRAIYDDDEEDNEDGIVVLTTRPSWFDSVLMARRLLAKSSVAIASTVYQPRTSSSSSPSTSNYYAPQPEGLQGVSISLPEYIADCSDVDTNGNPILLGLYVSTTFQNAAHGSNISLSIDWWDHLSKTDPVYPGFPLSEAGLPRVSLIGYLERIDLSSFSSTPSEMANSLEECFFTVHPDAKVWAPGNPDSPHAGFWARMVVTQAYWIGGFGDLQQIGWINMTEWRGVGRFESAAGIGDGRGWEDIKLPGE